MKEASRQSTRNDSPHLSDSSTTWKRKPSQRLFPAAEAEVEAFMEISFKPTSSCGLISKLTRQKMLAITRRCVSSSIFTITGSSFFSGTAKLLVTDPIRLMPLIPVARPAAIATRRQLSNAEFSTNSTFFSTVFSKRRR